MEKETPHKIAKGLTADEQTALAFYASLPNLPSTGPNVPDVLSGGGSMDRKFLVDVTSLAQSPGTLDVSLRQAASGPSQKAEVTSRPTASAPGHGD